MDTSYVFKEWDAGNPVPPSSLPQKKEWWRKFLPLNSDFAEFFGDHELSVGKMFQGLTGGLQFVIFSSIPALLSSIWQSWERLGKAWKGWERQPHLPCRCVSPSVPVKAAGSAQRAQIPSFFFWQLLTTIRDLFIYGLIIITLLMVFSKWESQVLQVAAIARSIVRLNQSFGLVNP